jgi:hypothetical protein
VEAARINWAGWDLVSIPLSTIGGSGEWQYHSVVVRQSSEGLKSGTIYFDDAMVITPTAIGDTEDDGTKLSVFPNPLTSEGRITFFLQSAGQVVLDLFASDGSLAANVFSGSMDAGPHSLPWSPSPAITPGVYTLRLSHRAGGEAAWRNAARRWVIMR